MNSDNREVSLLTEIKLLKLFAKRLQEIRKNELRLTQKSLTDAIVVKLRTLQDWENRSLSNAKASRNINESHERDTSGVA
jgi:hypothetical protein